MPLDRLEILHTREGNGVAVYDRRVLVFVRHSVLRVEALDVLEKAIQDLAPLAAVDRPTGVLAVVSADAGLSRNHLLTRQRKVFADHRKRAGVFVGFTVVGESAQATAMRAVVRLFALGQSHMKMFATTDATIDWLAPHLTLSPESLREAVRIVEDRLRSVKV